MACKLRRAVMINVEPWNEKHGDNTFPVTLAARTMKPADLIGYVSWGTIAIIYRYVDYRGSSWSTWIEVLVILTKITRRSSSTHPDLLITFPDPILPSFDLWFDIGIRSTLKYLSWGNCIQCEDGAAFIGNGSHFLDTRVQRVAYIGTM